MAKMSGFERKIAKMNFGYKARKEFYNQIISLSRAGVSKTDALRMIWDVSSFEGKKPKEGIPMVVTDVMNGLKEGKTFGQALSFWVPRDELMVIEAIENSNDFAGNLEEFLELSEMKKGIRGKIIGGLGYPVFLLSIVFAVIIYFGINVVPQVAAVIPEERWTGPAAMLRWMAYFANNFTIPTLSTMFIGLIAIYISLPRWVKNGRSFADNFPFYSTYRMYSGISFLTSIAALAKGGVPVVNAIERIRTNTTPYVRYRLDKVLRNMLDGQNFGSALYRAGTGWPDNKMSLSIKVFAETKDLGENLSRMSREWLKESDAVITRNMGVLKTFSMVLMFAVIMSIIAGIYSLQGQISMGGD